MERREINWERFGGLIFAICPECGQKGRLDNHTIAPNGDVDPSLDCPTPGCGFHEHCRLRRFEGGASCVDKD